MKKLILSLSLVALAQVPMFAAARFGENAVFTVPRSRPIPPPAVPIELRHVNGTNYNVGLLRVYPELLESWASRHDNSQAPIRPLPQWSRVIGKILEVRDGLLMVELGSVDGARWPSTYQVAVIRNVPDALRKGTSFDGYVYRTSEAFQDYGRRWSVYDFGTPVAAPTESASAAAERAEAKAKAAAEKKAALDAAVAKFRAEQAAASK